MSLNFKSGMQAKMAANRTVDAQTYLDQLAVIEQSLWKLTGDFSWRVPAGENYAYHGRTYSRRVFGPNTVAYPALANYADAVIISVRAPNATGAVNKSFRYSIDTPFLIRKPRQVHIDGVGNIFFADYDNHSVWKIDAATGAIVRVAGRGTSGSGGDGGPATEAELNTPRGVCTDALGNVYIADTGNNRIRKVSAGFISTVVNISGVAGDSGDEGLATAALLRRPFGVKADAAGNLYIADTENHRIRKVTKATGIITTIVNTTGQITDGTHPVKDGGAATEATLNSPCGVYLDSALNIYIADTSNNRIRKVTAATGIISTVVNTSGHETDYYHPLGDGGAATAATLNRPYGVWLDGAGNIFIADADNHRIRKVAAATGIITTLVNTAGIAGYAGDGGAATAAQIDWPTGLCVKSTGEVIISDTNNSCLRQVSITNTISTLPMTVGPGLSSPDGAVSYYDAAQKRLFLYIADSGNHRIRRLDTVTNARATVAGTGSAGSWGDGGQATAARLNSPSAVALDASGNLYIADTGNHKIRKVNVATGIISTAAGTGSAGYSGDGWFATWAKLDSPEGVCVDASGNIFIADTNNHRIRKFTVGGNISTVAGTGIAGYSGDGGAATSAMINNPQGVSVDAAGSITIADTGNHALRLVSSYTGNITTLAGTGTSGYNGDNRPAAQAQLSSPRGVALGLTKGAGRIFISDTGNNRIRTLSLKTEQRVYGP